jgi:hypothetical protein
MRFNDEIGRAIKHQYATDMTTAKTKDEIKAIENSVRSAVSSSSYDFSKSKSIVLKQGGKKRFVKQYSDIYSPESILCQCIKQILDRTFKIKYPNRNQSVRALFDILKAVKQMVDFTIIKYDFKDYFNSVSAPYVFEKYLKEKLTNRFEVDLIKEFTDKTEYAFAGFSTSNVIAEIIAQQFDTAVRIAFSGKGMLFFERYIDDSIIVFNEHIEENDCRSLLHDILVKIFHDNNVHTLVKCKTKFNKSKFIYISHRCLNITQKIDYWGYEFTLYNVANRNVDIHYGITQEKQKKYNDRIDSMIRLYKELKLKDDTINNDYHNMELLRHRIAAFTSRTVYQSRKFQSTVWKIKGFIGNYGELRYLLETPLIEATTKSFLVDMVNDAFTRAYLPSPYFMKGTSSKHSYSLFENMKTNKTLLLAEHIGYSKPALLNLCSQVGITPVDKNGKERGYGNLVREYLIKLKVGY